MSLCLYACFFYCYGDHRDLHVLTHSFPTRRSSDLSEWGEVPEATAALIAETRSAGGRVVATGTTTLRILEAAARADGSVPAWSGDTDLFITPGYRFKAVDLLLTNFHLPRSTLLMLVSAFVGRGRTDERRVGKEGGSSCRFRVAPHHS